MALDTSGFEAALGQSIDYLNSGEAIFSLEVDAYWPKWNSPWWHMMLLWEMGYADRIPRSSCESLVASLNANCVKFFPFTIEEVPEGVDPYRGVPCHCQLGNVYQVLTACGIDVDTALPWIRPWFLKYQLPDGGLNCDEAAYTRTVQKSSIVSTLPPLEAILFCTSGSYSSEEANFLDRGAQYLMDRKLFRSLNTGEVIDENWLSLCFPRFYDYDLLRGLNFILQWSGKRKKSVPVETVSEAVHILDKKFESGSLRAERTSCAGDNTWMRDNEGHWSKSSMTSDFPLLAVLRKSEVSSQFLSRQWISAKDCLNRLSLAI